MNRRVHELVARLVTFPLLVLAGQAHGAEAEAEPGVAFDVGGVFIEDATWLDDLPPRDSSSPRWRRRRATLEATLELGDSLELVAEGGYNNGTDFAWRDAYASLSLPGPWNVRAGLMKPAFGFAFGASLKNLFTPERSIALDLLKLERAPGLVVEATPGNHVAALGWFEDEIEDGETVHAGVARYLFAHEQDSSYWHAGVSLAHQDYDGAVFRIRSRAETGAADDFLRTERITTEYADYGGIDLVYRRGRLTLVGEGIAARVRSPQEGDRHYKGAYVQASWFLSADAHRFEDGGIQRLRPESWGAWELVGAAGRIDASSQGNGFAADTQSIGLNFYHGEHLKLMTQVDWLDVSGGTHRGRSGQFATFRLQYRF